MGRNTPIDSIVSLICREFNVNEKWLRYGEGDMFNSSDDEYVATIDRIMAGEDEARKSLFKFMLELSDEDIAALDRLMKKAIEFTQNNKEKD